MVGLTGGLASGKTTVAGWLRQAGHTVVDADRLVSELHHPGQPGARAVSEIFGAEALTAEGAVDRRWVAERVFTDQTARRRLEEAIHPLVRERFSRIAADTAGVAVLEASLLLEAGFATDFDLLVTIEADVETRVARAVGRGLREEDARARVAAQGTESRRREAADIVIDNNGDLAALRRQVDALLDAIERLAATRTGAPDAGR